MFIKSFSKYNKTTKERYLVYKLCESYRKNGGSCHHIIVSFGKLEELETVEQKKLLAWRIEDMLKNGVNGLCVNPIEEKVEHLAHYYYNEIIA